jgi:hypothetical protein
MNRLDYMFKIIGQGCQSRYAGNADARACGKRQLTSGPVVGQKGREA